VTRRPDFEQPVDAWALIEPLRALVGPRGENRELSDTTIQRLITLFANRDNALEQFLGNYADLDLAATTVTQGAGAATIDATNSMLRGRRLGTWAHVRGALAFTASTCVTGNAIVLTLPPGWERANLTTFGDDEGSFSVQRSAAAVFHVGMALSATALTYVGIATGTASSIGATPGFALAVGDFVRFNLHYELAAP